MEKNGMPNIPGMNAMTDTLEFVKNLWGGMKVPGVGMGSIPGMPGMVMPSLSVEEINKQIADLKAVESWLTVNMNMLRATIQALEVQSATLSTLKAMGDNLNSAMQNAAKEKPAARKSEPGDKAAADNAKEEARRKTRSRLKEEFKTAPPPEEEDASSPHAKSEVRSEAEPAKSGAAAGSDINYAAPLANPAVWWNLLQDQFKQAVGSAMSAESSAKPAARTPENGADTAAGNGEDKSRARRKPRTGTH
jgi:hypothetical protein